MMLRQRTVSIAYGPAPALPPPGTLVVVVSAGSALLSCGGHFGVEIVVDLQCSGRDQRRELHYVAAALAGRKHGPGLNKHDVRNAMAVMMNAVNSRNRRHHAGPQPAGIKNRRRTQRRWIVGHQGT